MFRWWKLLVCSRYQVEPCGSSARYQGSHEWRRVRQDRWRGRAFRGGLISVTFSTPPEKANGVHVLDYVTRIAGNESKAIQWSCSAARRSCDSTSARDRNRMIININVAVRVAALAFFLSFLSLVFNTKRGKILSYYSFNRIIPFSFPFVPYLFFLFLLLLLFRIFNG